MKYTVCEHFAGKIDKKNSLPVSSLCRLNIQAAFSPSQNVLAAANSWHVHTTLARWNCMKSCSYRPEMICTSVD